MGVGFSFYIYSYRSMHLALGKLLQAHLSPSRNSQLRKPIFLNIKSKEQNTSEGRPPLLRQVYRIWCLQLTPQSQLPALLKGQHGTKLSMAWANSPWELNVAKPLWLWKWTLLKLNTEMTAVSWETLKRETTKSLAREIVLRELKGSCYRKLRFMMTCDSARGNQHNSVKAVFVTHTNSI